MKNPKGVGKLRRILEKDKRYAPDAYSFVNEALLEQLRDMPKGRHISGRELLDGFRRLAMERYGNMSRLVFEAWGVFTCEDVGEIVFNLADAGILKTSASDTKADFQGAFSFASAFDKGEIEF